MDKLLVEIEQMFSSREISKSDVVYAMTNFRLFMEKNSLKSKFKILNLYCNWIVHNEISQSETAFYILDFLTDSMIAHNDGTNENKWINDAIIEGLKLHSLQSEILEFSNQFNIKLDIFRENTFWKDFGMMLLTILLDRPLTFPENITNKRVKKIYDSIFEKAHKTGKMVNGVISVSFTNYNNHIFWSIQTLMQKERNIKIMGPMSIITQEMVDKYKM